MTLHVLGRFDVGHRCWAFGPADASAIPASWTTAETLTQLLNSHICHGTEIQLEEGFQFLDANFIPADKGSGGWSYHDHIQSIWVEPTAWAIRAYIAGGRNEDLLAKGVSWLTANQNRDGGFGSTTAQESRVYSTAVAILALDEYLEHSHSGSTLQRGRVENTLSRALGWLIDPNTHVKFAWGTRARSEPNPASTAHALLALSSVAPKFSIASRFLVENRASLLQAFKRDLRVDAWDRQAEAYLLQDGDRQILHRHFWTVNAVALVALFQMARFLDALGDELPLLLDLEQSIILRLRSVENPPLHEATQAVWALSMVSPAIDSELMAPYYRLIAGSRPIDMGLQYYGSLRFVGLMGVLLYLIAGLEAFISRPLSPVFLLIASIYSFFVLHSLDRRTTKLSPRVMSRTVHVLLLVIQAIILTYSAQAVVTLIFPNTTLAIVVAISFTGSLFLGEYFKALFLSAVAVKEKSSKRRNP